MKKVMCLALLLLAGCSDADSPAGITGKVRLGDQPVTSGSVVFVTESGEKFTSGIGIDGTYRIRAITPGPARIMVIAHERSPFKETAGGPDDKRPASPPPTEVKIPPRYGQIQSSGLNYTVRKGKQKWDIELKP